MKIAICGGTLSGVTLARLLSSNSEPSTSSIESIDLYGCLHDPARAKPHPLCEYEPLSFSLSSNVDSRVEDEVDRWIGKGFVRLCGSDGGERKGPKMGVYDSSRNIGGNSLYMDDYDDGNVDHPIRRRYQPRRGFFTLLDELMQDFPKNNLQSGDDIPVRVSTEQMVALDRQQPRQPQPTTDSTNNRNNEWFLRDAGNKQHGPYDLVLFAYDASPRAARKASFKQLLESALPLSSSLLHSLARAVSASAMTAIVAFPRTDITSFDCIRFEGVPAVRFASRNRHGDAASHRGMRVTDNEDVWTLVATPEWSYRARKAHAGRWDKKAVGHDMVKSFAEALGVEVGAYRSVVPTFHWQGSSSLTRTSGTADVFAIDAEVGLGFCGDIFGGQGVEGAVLSAAELARHVRSENSSSSSLPVTVDAWMLRTPGGERDYDNHDTNSIFGSFTGRDEPREDDDDLLDRTWPAVVDIARGKVVTSADSLKKYRRRGNKNSRNGNNDNRKDNNSSSRNKKQDRRKGNSHNKLTDTN